MITTIKNARVAKLADARDLKSRVPKGTYRFNSDPGHQCSSEIPRLRSGFRRAARATRKHRNLLLLLFLLLPGQILLLDGGWCPTDYHGGREVFGRGCLGEIDGDGNAQLALSSPFEDTASRRDFRIVAAHGHADVAIAAEYIVGGIELGPAESWQ